MNMEWDRTREDQRWENLDKINGWLKIGLYIIPIHATNFLTMGLCSKLRSFIVCIFQIVLYLSQRSCLYKYSRSSVSEAYAVQVVYLCVFNFSSFR